MATDANRKEIMEFLESPTVSEIYPNVDWKIYNKNPNLLFKGKDHTIRGAVTDALIVLGEPHDRESTYIPFFRTTRGEALTWRETYAEIDTLLGEVDTLTSRPGIKR